MRMIRFFAAIVIVFLALLSPVMAQKTPETYDPLRAIPRASDGRIEFEYNGYRFVIDEEWFGSISMYFEQDFVPSEAELPFFDFRSSPSLQFRRHSYTQWDKEMMFTNLVPTGFQKDLGESKRQIFASLMKKSKSISFGGSFPNQDKKILGYLSVEVASVELEDWIVKQGKYISMRCEKDFALVKNNISDPEVSKKNVLYLNHESGFDFFYKKTESKDSCNILPANKRLFKTNSDLVVSCLTFKTSGCVSTPLISVDKKIKIKFSYGFLDEYFTKLRTGKAGSPYPIDEFLQSRNTWREKDFLQHEGIPKIFLSPVPEWIE